VWSWITQIIGLEQRNLPDKVMKQPLRLDIRGSDSVPAKRKVCFSLQAARSSVLASWGMLAKFAQPCVQSWENGERREDSFGKVVYLCALLISAAAQAALAQDFTTISGKCPSASSDKPRQGT
jgi:hypothetical protein